MSGSEATSCAGIYAAINSVHSGVLSLLSIVLCLFQKNTWRSVGRIGALSPECKRVREVTF